MRIIFLNPIGTIGGAERSLLDLLASLQIAHPTWDLQLIAGGAGPLSQAAEALGIQSHAMHLPAELARIGDASIGADGLNRAAFAFKVAKAGLHTFAYLRSLRALLRNTKPAVIHSNGFKMHILASWAKPRGVKLVWHVHDYVSTRPIMCKLMELHTRACSAVIANSDSVAEDVRRVCGDRLRIHKLWNCVDLSEFSPCGTRLDLDTLARLETPVHPVFRVGLVATFARWKGHEVFLRALAMIPPDIPVRGYVVGGGVYQTEGSQWCLEDLRQLASGLGLDHKIGFTGFVGRPAEAIRALDVVVHASTEREPFGLVIVEAMACGRPVLTSRLGGSAEVTPEGSGALECAPGDPASLAQQIVRLARDRVLWNRLSVAGRGNAENNFDRTRLGPACTLIYKSVVGAQADGPLLTKPGVPSQC